MNEYNDSWNEFSLPPGQSQKARGHQYLSENIGKMSLTPDEDYSMAWGPDALSEDWIKQKAQAIQSKIENDTSTSILRGTPMAPSQKAEVKTDDPLAKAAAAGVSTQSGGSSSGSSGGPSADGDFKAADDSMPTFGHDKAMQAAAIAGAKDFAKFGSVLGPMLGGGIGLYKGYQAYKDSLEASQKRQMPAINAPIYDQTDTDSRRTASEEAAATEAFANSSADNLTPAEKAAYAEYASSRSGGGSGSDGPSISSEGGMSMSQATSTEGTGSPTSPSGSTDSDSDDS